MISAQELRELRDFIWDLKQSIKKHEWEEAMEIIEELEQKLLKLWKSLRAVKRDFPMSRFRLSRMPNQPA